MMLNLKIPNLSTSKWIAISFIVVAIIAIFVLFKQCKPIQRDYKQATIDSIIKNQKTREDSLTKIIDSADEAIRIATDNSNNFYLEAEKQKDRANIASNNFQGLKKKYEVLKSMHDSTAFDAADSAIGAAQETIIKKDSVIKYKEKMIDAYRIANSNLKTKADALQVSREQFKSDFMKLNTNVVIPLQAQLKEANKQWAANRFWKKTFAGAAAAAIIYGTVQTFKK